MMSFGLFRRHDAEMAAVAHGAVDRLLGELVELHDGLAVDIDLAGFAENLHEARLVDFPRNDLGCDDQAGEQER